MVVRIKEIKYRVDKASVRSLAVVSQHLIRVLLRGSNLLKLKALIKLFVLHKRDWIENFESRYNVIRK